MRIAVPRTCLRCGLPLPEGCSQSRKYCDECGKLRSKELAQARARKAAERRYVVLKAKQETKDKEYCRGCFYAGSEDYGNNLCDYILKTGKRRGCKSGVGCDKRQLKDNNPVKNRKKG